MTTFTRVIFPLSTPGIISGCVLVFTMSMTSYVTPKLLGGSKFRMMATMVVQEINVSFDWGARRCHQLHPAGGDPGGPGRGGADHRKIHETDGRRKECVTAM